MTGADVRRKTISVKPLLRTNVLNDVTAATLSITIIYCEQIKFIQKLRGHSTIDNM